MSEITTPEGANSQPGLCLKAARQVRGLTLKQVLDALNGANVNVGANTVNIGPQSAVIRSVGQIRSMDDIRNTMLVVRDSGTQH